MILFINPKILLQLVEDQDFSLRFISRRVTIYVGIILFSLRLRKSPFFSRTFLADWGSSEFLSEVRLNGRSQNSVINSSSLVPSGNSVGSPVQFNDTSLNNFRVNS